MENSRSELSVFDRQVNTSVTRTVKPKFHISAERNFTITFADFRDARDVLSRNECDNLPLEFLREGIIATRSLIILRSHRIYIHAARAELTDRIMGKRVSLHDERQQQEEGTGGTKPISEFKDRNTTNRNDFLFFSPTYASIRKSLEIQRRVDNCR